MRIFSVLFVIVFFPFAASAEEFPTRKAGLWEIKSSDSTGAPPQMIKQCVDAETDKAMFQAATGVMQQPGMNCTKMEIRKEGSGYVSEANCQMMGMSMQSKSVITGDFDSNYSSKTTTKMTPPMMGNGVTESTTTAKWVGECEPGQVPGDVVMDGGAKMNMNKMFSQGGLNEAMKMLGQQGVQ